MLNLGWVDFSKSDCDMVLSVLRQLTEPGAVDEIGIGAIRDGFSDILFPGTSTLQTRAKYLFIVPYICMELERNGRLAPREFINALEQNELDLINVLAVNGAEGVIGQRSRQTLKRKPSGIYWSALRTFGFLSESVSLSEYAALTYVRRTAADHQKSSGKRRSRYEDDVTDDTDAGMGGTPIWRVPVSGGKWRDNLTIDLTSEEAKYLREKITTMPGTRDSLLSMVLRENRLDFVEYENFDDIDDMMNVMPTGLRRDYQLARAFSKFIYGAQVRYNILFSKGLNEEAVEEWNRYVFEKHEINLSEIQARLKPRASVMSFLKRFQASIGNTDELDNLLICREKELKGSARAKLTNSKLYTYNDNNVNMVPLSYRLYNAQQIIRDIFEGVKSDA